MTVFVIQSLVEIFEIVNNSYRIYFMTNFLFLILWFIFLFTVFLILKTQMEKEKCKTEIRMYQKISKVKEEYYKMVSEKNKMLIGFKHDYYEHMKILKMLILKEENIKAQEYIDKICEHNMRATINIKTGNTIINSIIHDCINKFENTRIDFSFEGKFPEEVNINGMDMCTIFSNVIINSFEAASKFNGKKYVNMHIRRLNENYFITIKNPHNGILENRSFLRVSTKSDNKNHGIGIKNARKILEIYKGKLEYEVWDKEITTKILVSL